MTTGFLNPVAGKTGNVRDNVYNVLLKGLLDGNGTALTQNPNSMVYTLAIADSRAIAASWEQAERLRYCNDPNQMTEPFLSRWEVILGLSSFGLNDSERRRQVGLKMKFRNIVPNYSGLYDLLKELIPDIFVDLFNYDHTQVVSSIPGGLTIPGWQVLQDGSRSSNVHRAYIQVQKPLIMTEGQFQDQVGLLPLFLPTFLPGWTTWNWFVVPDQIGTFGFFLDQRNLEYLALDAG